MLRKIRSNIWFVKGIFNRYSKIILSSFLLGLILVVVGVKIKPNIWGGMKDDRKVIGIVGSYSPSNLPPQIQRLISSGLTDISEEGEAVPSLATDWEMSEDGKRYTFHLRDDLYWHDGQKFTAKDVNYNLRDVEFVPIASTELVVKLKDEFTPLPNFLSKALFRKGLVGLGSYRISSIRLKGENVRFLKLVSQAADLPPIEIRFYASETQAKTAFKLGEVNVLDEISDPAPFDRWETINIKELAKQNRYVAIFFNVNHEFLKDKEVRQALAYAVEKPEKNRVATSLSTKSWAYTTQVKLYEKDLEQAKKLLGDNKSSPAGTLTLSTFAAYLPLAQSIATSWNQIGIATHVKVESGIPEDFQILLATQEIPTDPDQYTLWHSTQTSTNISHYASPKIDKLLEDGRKERDKEVRREIYFDFQRFIVDDAPAVFLFHPTTYTISKK